MGETDRKKKEGKWWKGEERRSGRREEKCGKGRETVRKKVREGGNEAGREKRTEEEGWKKKGRRRISGREKERGKKGKQ